MNVQNTVLAQNMHRATTLLEVITVHVTQDLNLVVEGQRSRAWKNPVKVGESVDQELK